MNPLKSKIIKFTYKRKVTHHPVLMGGVQIPTTESTKYLGLILDNKLTWNLHITSLIQKLRQRIRQVKHLVSGQSPTSLHYKRLVYTSLIRPIWQYSCSIWGSASPSQINRIQRIQNRYLRLITGAPWYVRNTTLHADLGIPEDLSVLRTSYKQLHSSCLSYI